MGTRDQESGLHARGLSPRTPAAARGGLDTAAMQHLLGYLLAMAAVGTQAVYEQHIGRRFELREVEFTLLVLLQANHGATPKQLATTLNLTPPKLTALLDRLTERGLVERRRSSSDGRARPLHLTPAGEALAARAHTASLAMEDALLAGLSAAERAMLRELLIKVGQAGALVRR